MSVSTQASSSSWYWANNNVNVATGVAPNNYDARNGYCYVKIQMASTSTGALSITAVPTTSTYQWEAGLTIHVDNVFHQFVPFNMKNAGVAQTVAVRGLPAGAHVITITQNGIDVIGSCNITALTFDGTVLPVTTPTRALVMYGDSLTAGVNSGGEQSGLQGRVQCFAMRMRNSSRFDRVTTLGRAGAFLSTLTASGATISAVVAEVQLALTGSVENVAYFELVTNDYGASSITAATVQTRYASLITALQAAIPSLAGKLFISTMFKQSTSGNNAFGAGNAWADYNAAILAAATASGGYAVGIDASATVVAADLTTWGGDGSAHFGNTGHLAVYNQLVGIL